MFSTLTSYLTKKSWWMDVVFYFASALLIAVVFSYLIFTLKIYLQKREIADADKNIAVYGTQEQKAYEKKILDYKRLIDDFTVIVGKHKISSNIFSFIEDNTVPSVWFSNFDMSDSTNEIRLLGEAENMLTLSQQVQVFEKDKEYIKNITVLNSQAGVGGKIGFILNLSLGSKIFTYQSEPLIPNSVTQ